MSKYPTHAYLSARAFKTKKRADLRAALKAVETLRYGCAYTPTKGRIVEAYRLLEEAKQLMSVKNWGR